MTTASGKFLWKLEQSCWAEKKNYYALSAGGENWCQKRTFAARWGILNKRIARSQAGRSLLVRRGALLFWRNEAHAVG